MGHFARECPTAVASGPGGFGARGSRMGGFGAPRGGAGFGRDAASCYNCNKPGHIARDCPDSGNKTCYNCGKAGHISRDCDVGGGSSSMMGSIGGAGRRDVGSLHVHIENQPGHGNIFSADSFASKIGWSHLVSRSTSYECLR